MRHRTAIASLVVVAALVVGATAASAQATDPEPPPIPSGPRIVGGTVADPGEFPFAAALVVRGEPREMGFSCGASVISRTWILTAAHCMVDGQDRYDDARYGIYVAPSHYDVVTGTSDLLTGGQRTKVAAVYVHPGYQARTSDWDVALLRLAGPVTAGAVGVIGTSSTELALDDPGTTATVMGWGLMSEQGTTLPADLRKVDIPVIGSSDCAASYPLGFEILGQPFEYHADNMVCAGALEGGKDSCQGDSGGPLVVKAGDGSFRQIGTVSFGFGCARPGYPGVYHRLTSTSSWVGRTRRFGPFDADGVAFLVQQYRDFAGRTPTAAELVAWRDRLTATAPADIIAELAAGAAWDGNAGMNVRLYRAAFGRAPDTAGLDYWVRQRWAGRSARSIADHFAASSEFRSRYGDLADDAFVDLLYQNVFDRPADAGGRTYWIKRLAAGTSRGTVLLELSSSSEFRRDTATVVRITTTRFGLLRAVPTAGELAASEALTQTALIDVLRSSYRYAARFD